MRRAVQCGGVAALGTAALMLAPAPRSPSYPPRPTSPPSYPSPPPRHRQGQEGGGGAQDGGGDRRGGDRGGHGLPGGQGDIVDGDCHGGDDGDSDGGCDQSVQLARRGVAVTVVEEREGPGEVASLCNGAILCQVGWPGYSGIFPVLWTFDVLH